MRILPHSLDEASADLGATAWQAILHVTWMPQFAQPLPRSRLLSFALSFDKVVVTVFTSSTPQNVLPIWIFATLRPPSRAAHGERRRASS